MYEQNEMLKTEIKTIEKKNERNLELKNTMTELKNSVREHQ